MTAKDSKNYDIDVLFPATGEESRLLVGCRRDSFSASRIARAVEDCDAHLVNLNVLGLEHPEAETVVELRINRRNAAEVARSLLRYGYDVLGMEPADGADPADTTLSDRIDELLHYLEL